MSRTNLWVRMFMLLYVTVSLMTVSLNSGAAEPYLKDNRVAYVENVLQAFRQTKLQKIFNTFSYINAVEKNNCRSTLSDLKVQCLLSFARKNCSAAGSARLQEICELYSDIIVVNKLSEHVFISRSERYHLTRNSNLDFRTVLTNRLRQKYGKLVTQYTLTSWSDCKKDDLKCVAAGLDQFCLDYTNSNSLSWQYCMSASLWFIGTSKQD